MHHSFKGLFLTFLVLLNVGPSLCAQSPYVAVEIRSGKVYINGTHVTRETTIVEYKAILGPPDRTTTLSNTIYTYDSLGILLYQRHGEQSVLSISLELVPHKYKFSSKKPFQGVFVAENMALRSNFEQAALRSCAALTVSQDDTSLAMPVTKVRAGGIILIFEFLTSRRQLDGVGISWGTGVSP